MSSSAVDEAVIALLAADERIVFVEDTSTVVADDQWPLFDGHVVDSDGELKTISAPLPYLVFYSTPGLPVRPRAGRTSTMRMVEFQITAVGIDRWQAKQAAARAEGLLDGMTIDPTGDRPRKVRRTGDNLYVARDDTWMRPDGGPLFFCPTRYVATTKR